MAKESRGSGNVYKRRVTVVVHGAFVRTAVSVVYIAAEAVLCRGRIKEKGNANNNIVRQNYLEGPTASRACVNTQLCTERIAMFQ